MSKNLSDIFPPTEIGGGGGSVEEAPKTGKLYARKDEAWQEFEAGDIEPGNQDGEILTWSTADAEWMPSDDMIVKGGNVGINNDDPTSYYANRFVVGASYADGITIASEAPNQLNYLSFANSDAKASIAGAIGYYHSANAYNPDTMNFITAGTERMRIDSNGNVGIGTDSPIAKTHIAKTSGTALVITSEATNSNTQSGYIDFQGSSSGAGQGARIAAPFETTYGRTGLAFYTSNTASDTFTPEERMRIDANGNINLGPEYTGVRANQQGQLTFFPPSGVGAWMWIGNDGGSLLFRQGGNWSTDGTTTAQFHPSGNATFMGTVVVNGNRPVISTRDLIETLSTLRNATKDETTLEGLRDAIGNAVGGLIEKFEAMQNAAVTQEIPE